MEPCERLQRPPCRHSPQGTGLVGAAPLPGRAPPAASIHTSHPLCQPCTPQPTMRALAGPIAGLAPPPTPVPSARASPAPRLPGRHHLPTPWSSGTWRAQPRRSPTPAAAANGGGGADVDAFAAWLRTAQDQVIQVGLGWAQGYRLLSGGVLGAEWGRGGPWGWLLAPAWCADAGRSGVCRRPQHPAPPPPPAFTPTYTASTTPQPTPPHQAAEALDGSGVTFRRDPWARPPGNANAGSGVTAVLEGGELLEKAAVSVTAVRGVLSAPRAAAMAARQQRGGGGGGEGGGGGPATPRPPRAGDPYAAAALSLVFHPASPHVPTLRGDVRKLRLYVERTNAAAQRTYAKLGMVHSHYDMYEKDVAPALMS